MKKLIVPIALVENTGFPYANNKELGFDFFKSLTTLGLLTNKINTMSFFTVLVDHTGFPYENDKV